MKLNWPEKYGFSVIAESGMDPAEWAAKLEDRFYNNHAFKSPEVVV